MKLFKIQKNHLIIIFITISLLSLKWVLSYLNFPEEGINLRVMFEVTDSSYFPLIKSFSNLDFNPSFNPEITNLKLVSYPILLLLPISILLKFFGSYAFLIIEFISVFIFLQIFQKIFYSMKISNMSSIFFSLILFTTPFFLNQLSFLNIDLINKINLNFYSFYNLRTPRPLISNLYLFIYLYYLIKFFYLEERTTVNYITISITMGLSLHAFFYFFIFETFLLLFLYLIFFKSKIFNFIKVNYKSHIISFFIILSFVFLFILQLYFSENDYRQRMGIFYMDFEKKILTINYLINFLTKIEFIFLLVVNIFLFYVCKNKFNQIFFYFFLSTIFSTIFFIFFSPSSMDYYHFFNWILLSGAISLLIALLFIFEKKFISLIPANKKKMIIISIILLIIANYNFFYNKVIHLDKQNSQTRVNLSKLIKFIKNDEVLSNKDSEILTLSYNAFIILTLNDFYNFYLIPSSLWTSKKNNTIENELISSFKFLNLTDADFLDYFKNKKFGYRYSNVNIKNYFDRLYLANKLKTFNHISNFNPDYRSIINKTSILYTHQTIIPINEFSRLQNKFINFNKNIRSKIIILENNNTIINSHYLNPKYYCLRYQNDEFFIYVSRADIKKCVLVKN